MKGIKNKKNKKIKKKQLKKQRKNSSKKIKIKNKKIKETTQRFTVDCYSERLNNFSIFYNRILDKIINKIF
jgi:hypothetical protein